MIFSRVFTKPLYTKEVSALNIEPGRIINDFIEPNKIQYAIPVYQRNYEWPENQCKKLFEDIIVAYKKDTTHFCGSIVRKMIEEKKGIYHYVIIDGQQRLTTIYLLIKALLDCAESEGAKEKFEESLFNADKFDELSLDVSNKLKLKPIKSDGEQLFLLMANKYDEIDKTSGLWNNYQLFKELIEDELSKGLYTKDIYKGIEKLICAKITLDEGDNAQEIFERINSTGVPLSLADKIRNFVLMTEVDQERLYEEYWIDFEKLISKKQRSDYIISFLNLKNEGFAKESDAYDIFKNLFRKKNYTNELMLKELVHYAGYYHAFIYGDANYSEQVNEYLDGLRKLKQTTSFVFLFEVFDDYEKGIINESELERVLQFLLNYSIRRIICEIGSNSLRGLYKTLYSRIFTKVENKDKYYDSIVSFFKQLSSKDILPNDELFEEALKFNNLYRKNALCKYLLVAIENKGKEKIETDTLTIEHILPQNENMSVKWQEMLGKNWKEDKERFLHTLGNLTITGYNSELGDRPFDEKKEMLSGSECKIVDLNKDIVSQEKWNKDTIKSRANRLISEIERLFPIEEPEVFVSFEDPRYKMYTCEEPDNATSKYINYYVMQGEKVIVNSFSEMLRSVIERLYEENAIIIETMAQHETPIFDGSELALFSYNLDSVQNGYKLAETGIFVSTNFSASRIMKVIRTLLDKYEMEYEDLVYSARSYAKKEK